MKQQILTKEQARFIHRRHDLKEFGVREFTVAYIIDEVTGQMYAAFSYCSLKDNYNRKLGADLALSRLNAGLAGAHQSFEYFLPLTNVTSFFDARALREFAVAWGERFA